MIYANDLHETKIKAAPGVEGWCPACHEGMIPKCGEIKIWHWAHIAREDCDPWHEPMTEWHLRWQSLFPDEWREVVISKPAGKLLEADRPEIHRADVQLPGGVVIEFQHSSISSEMIKARENFYQRVIWIFDVEEPYRAGRFNVLRSSGFDKFFWLQSRASVSFCTRAVVFDFNQGEVLQVSKMHPPEKETYVPAQFDNQGKYTEGGYTLKSRPMGGWGHILKIDNFIAWLKAGKNL